jgi:hypothetical protein
MTPFAHSSCARVNAAAAPPSDNRICAACVGEAIGQSNVLPVKR